MTFNIITHASPYWPESKVYLDGFSTIEERNTAIERLSLKYSTWFFEALTSFDGHPTRLEKFQIDYLLDNSQFKITNKSRQMGGSLQLSLAKFHTAYTTPYYRCDIISINLKEAADKIKYIRNFWDTLPGKWQIPLTVDSVLKIGFHQGSKLSEIQSQAASSGVRGGRKDVVFDEFAHIERAEDLWIAAAPAAINNRNIEVVSTPLGKMNIFGQMYLNLPNEFGKYPYKNFSRHHFIWIDSARFSKNLEEGRKRWYEDYQENMAMMEALVDEFATDALMMYYDMYPTEMFYQEFGGAFLDESISYLPTSLLNKVFKGSLGRVETEDEVFEEDYLPIISARPEDNTNRYIMGVDFGDSGENTDKTSIQIFEKDEKGIFKHRHSEILSKRDFPDFPSQTRYIAKLAREWQVNKIVGDETGLGRGVIPYLREHAPEISVEGVNFNIKTKDEMAINLKLLMEKGKLWLMNDHPDSMKIRAELMSIRRIVSENPYPKYEAQKSGHGKPHDDIFWSIALAVKEGTFKHFGMYTASSLKKVGKTWQTT